MPDNPLTSDFTALTSAEQALNFLTGGASKTFQQGLAELILLFVSRVPACSSMELHKYLRQVQQWMESAFPDDLPPHWKKSEFNKIFPRVINKLIILKDIAVTHDLENDSNIYSTLPLQVFHGPNQRSIVSGGYQAVTQGSWWSYDSNIASEAKGARHYVRLLKPEHADTSLQVLSLKDWLYPGLWVERFLEMGVSVFDYKKLYTKWIEELEIKLQIYEQNPGACFVVYTKNGTWSHRGKAGHKNNRWKLLKHNSQHSLKAGVYPAIRKEGVGVHAYNKWVPVPCLLRVDGKNLRCFDLKLGKDRDWIGLELLCMGSDQHWSKNKYTLEASGNNVRIRYSSDLGVGIGTRLNQLQMGNTWGCYSASLIPMLESIFQRFFSMQKE